VTNEIDQVHVQGIRLFLDEMLFYHRRSRSLIVADLLFDLSEKDAWITRNDGFAGYRPFPVANSHVFIGPPLPVADACARQWSGYLLGIVSAERCSRCGRRAFKVSQNPQSLDGGLH
jgi:hypothetical protein